METKAFSVSELTGLIKGRLESDFPHVLVEGELSNFRPASSGHWYFTLKDSGAAISAVMFKNRHHTVTFKPLDGDLVRVKGSISVYAQRGAYQIVCEEMDKSGEGDILALLEKRKRALAAEGLFDEERKKPLPRFPETIGVVTSPTGAALRDILNVLRRRAAGVKIVVLPAIVQGADAAPQIVRRIEEANEYRIADVLIVGRGGGSLEDLLPFSDEAVVRAVAASAIPVVSAVGHEIDWALCDYAADLRAPTPSAAAELVSDSRAAIAVALPEFRADIARLLCDRLKAARLFLRPFSAEEMEYRFRGILQPRLVRLDDAREELAAGMKERASLLRRRLEKGRAILDAASPLAILERGYSVVTNTRTGAIVRGAADAKSGDTLHIKARDGSLTATAA